MIKLNDEQRMIIDSVRRIVAREIAPRAAELDETAGFPQYAVDAFAANGVLNCLLPAQYGGVELSMLMFSMVLEEIAKSCAASALVLIAQTDGTLPIIHGGSQALKEKYLPRLSGESRQLAAVAATEPSAGSDILSLRTRAVRKGDKYIINGQKCFITNGSVADFFVVYAYTDPSKKARGISAFVAEKGFPGLSYGKNENKMGMRGSINSELIFEDMEVPAENLIGQEGDGFANLMQTLSLSRLMCASQAVGIARGALRYAIDYARQRVQFGKPISSLVPIQFMIADMAAGVESARLLTHKAAHMFDDGQAEEAGTFAAMAKFTASDTAMRVTTDAVQILGGYGYMKDYPVERMMRDAKLTQIYTGTNQIMRLVAGRALSLPPEN
ncbi:MAG: acyl-CoA dehydrogenase family protein [Syntrophobacteraceae bacterium]|nr:acyl-CoA dehydrogenase family protein [Syntrophobacteraceae bacterium]